MNPFQTIIFLVFVLPAVMIKDLWKKITKNMTKEDKMRWLWRIPQVLIFLLVLLMIILWSSGVR